MKKNRMVKGFLAGVMSAALTLSAFAVPAYADNSTTTYHTAYKDLNPRTEIYAVSDQPGDHYPYYGAVWEPTSGVWYGRIASGGPVGDGWGLTNGDGLADESAFSFYYPLGNEYTLEYWSYIYGSLMDGNRAFLLNLNFNNEGADCPRVLRGEYDGQLEETFTYLSEVNGPVLMRIGGEVNVWTDMPQAEEFIAAYRHIAGLARKYCPNVALVFSPSYSSSYGVDMDSFYPGDTYVDWIGASLYYNYCAANGDTERDAFYGVGLYGDALLNIQQTVNLAEMHQKPIIITEGGSMTELNGADLSPFAAERVQRAFTYLTMVYPQIKCIIYSDSNFGFDDSDYTITGNSVMERAYADAVADNPTLVHSWKDAGACYTKLSDYPALWSGKVELTAYSYSSGRLTARWYIDDNLVKIDANYPYHFAVDTTQLAEGSHTISVEFSDGNAKSYTFWVEKEGAEEIFSDVSGEAYYAPAVLWAVNSRVAYGTTDGAFSPDVSCTRGQTVAFLWRAMGCPEPKGNSTAFIDVPADAYYATAVRWAEENGIIYGTSAEQFSPEETVTRAQFVTFLWRCAGSPAVSSLSPFEDVPAGQYYTTAVHWALLDQVTAGTSSSTFSPELPCTRAQVVTFLYRYLGR